MGGQLHLPDSDLFYILSGDGPAGDIALSAHARRRVERVPVLRAALGLGLPLRLRRQRRRRHLRRRQDAARTGNTDGGGGGRIM